MTAALSDTLVSVGGLIAAIVGVFVLVVGVAYVFRGLIMKQALEETRAQNDELRKTLQDDRGDCDRKLAELQAQVDRMVGRLDQQDDRHADRMVEKLTERFEFKIREAS